MRNNKKEVIDQKLAELIELSESNPALQSILYTIKATVLIDQDR